MAKRKNYWVELLDGPVDLAGTRQLNPSVNDDGEFNVTRREPAQPQPGSEQLIERHLYRVVDEKPADPPRIQARWVRLVATVPFPNANVRPK